MSSLKSRRYEIGGYSGDQLEPLIDAMIREADQHWLGREPLREVALALCVRLCCPEALTLRLERPLDVGTLLNDLPQGVYSGANRYDTETDLVLHLWTADGHSFDVRARR